MRLLYYLNKILNPKPCHSIPHRWTKKNNIEEWILNHHPESGYPNSMKDAWKSKLDRKNAK